MTIVGGRNRTGWWVTTANRDVDAFNALALAASLHVTLTTRKLCVLVGGGVSQEMQAVLAQAFDYKIGRASCRERV